jgi:putative transposase
MLKRLEVKISMDGKGRAIDNIFIERLWRTIKYEHLYLHNYDTVISLMKGLKRFFLFYNEQRVHQSLGYKTPMKIYKGEDSSKPLPGATLTKSVVVHKCMHDTLSGSFPYSKEFLINKHVWHFSSLMRLTVCWY